MTKVHGKRYAYKFDFQGLAAATQPAASDPAYKYQSDLFMSSYHHSAKLSSFMAPHAAMPTSSGYSLPSFVYIHNYIIVKFCLSEHRSRLDPIVPSLDWVVFVFAFCNVGDLYWFWVYSENYDYMRLLWFVMYKVFKISSYFVFDWNLLISFIFIWFVLVWSTFRSRSIGWVDSNKSYEILLSFFEVKVNRNMMRWL